MQNYEYVSTLGAGAYGVVWRCREISTGRMVAVKAFKQAHESKEIMRLARREVQVLESVRHPNVVQLVEAFRSPRSGRVYMVFEEVTSCVQTELRRYPGGLPPRLTKVVVWQLLHALTYLHSNKILHRDVKPANVLLGNGAVVKLCDFGFSRGTSCEPTQLMDATSYVVTRWYRAPEILLSDCYGPSADIWSLGCTIAEIATGRPLFPGNSTLDQLWHITNSMGPLPQHLAARLAAANVHMTRSEVPASTPHSMLKAALPELDSALLLLVQACLQPDAKQRPTAVELLRNPYFRGVLDLVAGSPVAELPYARQQPAPATAAAQGSPATTAAVVVSVGMAADALRSNPHAPLPAEAAGAQLGPLPASRRRPAGARPSRQNLASSQSLASFQNLTTDGYGTGASGCERPSPLLLDSGAASGAWGGSRCGANDTWPSLESATQQRRLELLPRGSTFTDSTLTDTGPMLGTPTAASTSAGQWAPPGSLSPLDLMFSSSPKASSRRPRCLAATADSTGGDAGASPSASGWGECASPLGAPRAQAPAGFVPPHVRAPGAALSLGANWGSAAGGALSCGAGRSQRDLLARAAEGSHGRSSGAAARVPGQAARDGLALAPAVPSVSGSQCEGTSFSSHGGGTSGHQQLFGRMSSGGGGGGGGGGSIARSLRSTAARLLAMVSGSASQRSSKDRSSSKHSVQASRSSSQGGHDVIQVAVASRSGAGLAADELAGATNRSQARMVSRGSMDLVPHQVAPRPHSKPFHSTHGMLGMHGPQLQPQSPFQAPPAPASPLLHHGMSALSPTSSNPAAPALPALLLHRSGSNPSRLKLGRSGSSRLSSCVLPTDVCAAESSGCVSREAGVSRGPSGLGREPSGTVALSLPQGSCAASDFEGASAEAVLRAWEGGSGGRVTHTMEAAQSGGDSGWQPVGCEVVGVSVTSLAVAAAAMGGGFTGSALLEDMSADACSDVGEELEGLWAPPQRAVTTPLLDLPISGEPLPTMGACTARGQLAVPGVADGDGPVPAAGKAEVSGATKAKGPAALMSSLGRALRTTIARKETT